MQEIYIREEKVFEKSEIEKEKELVKDIIKTKRELEFANKNFEFAEEDLIDYYIYQIKANQSKLDYLIRLAKKNGINVSNIKELEYNIESFNENVV